MKTITIPFEFSMENCPWIETEGIRQYSAHIELTDEEVQRLKDTASLKEEHPLLFQKLDNAVNELCKKISYRYALINEFEEEQIFYDNEEQMMGIFEKESLFVYDPDAPGTDPDKKAEFSIWLEEYFFDLDEEQMVEFIEKYYGYTADRLTEENLAYKYTFSVPKGVC